MFPLEPLRGPSVDAPVTVTVRASTFEAFQPLTFPVTSTQTGPVVLKLLAAEQLVKTVEPAAQPVLPPPELDDELELLELDDELELLELDDEPPAA
jgi:hypothetical protein